MKQEIMKDLRNLLENYVEVPSNKWQSVLIDQKNPICSIYDVSNKIIVEEGEQLDDVFSPDLPWAEDHFQERVKGEPLNPGEQFKNWPYYKNYNNDTMFRSSGQFSHSYMERIWCKNKKGIRFDYGDLNDIIDRINSDNFTRQAFLSIWHPEDQSNNEVRLPCTIGYFFFLSGGRLNIKFLIRSCDAIRHFKNDLYMSYRLLEFVSEKTGLKAGFLSYWIGSFHCFKSDLYRLSKEVVTTDKNN